MNQRPPANEASPARERAATAHPLARIARAALATIGVALCAFAQSTPEASGLERLVAADAARHLDSADPEIRGEAALIVAAAGGREHEARLLELADDPSPTAARRATVALGLLATPTAVQKLEERLRTVEGREGDDAVAAAFALGLVPVDAVDTSVARTLTLFRQGSWKRQRDVLVALLLAMSRQPERAEIRALRDLYDDDDNRRHADVRALLLSLLLPIDRTLDERALQRTLRRGSAPEQLATLRHLANRAPEEITPWLDELQRIATRDDDPAHRATALLAMTRCRHLPALELAARALRSDAPLECAQGMQAMLVIGGASTRGALEQHLLEERDPDRLAALLRAFQAPPTAQLADAAVALARDAKAPMATRTAAAVLLARSKPQRAAPMLRDLFRAADERALLEELALALQSVEATPTALGRLLDQPVELAQHPDRWRALLVAGHGEAQRQVLKVLQATDSSPQDVRVALRAWRSARVLATPTAGPAEAPSALSRLLD